MLPTLERLSLDTAAAWEHQGIAHGARRPLIGAVDETCWQRLMLVLMALARGYPVVAEGAGERTEEPGNCLVTWRLKTFGVRVSDLVSARAQALSKRAQTGLDGLSIPEVLHLSHTAVPPPPW